MRDGCFAIVSGSQAMVPFFAEALDAPRKKFLPVGMPPDRLSLENEEKLRLCASARGKGRKPWSSMRPPSGATENIRQMTFLRAMDWDKYVLIVKATSKGSGSFGSQVETPRSPIPPWSCFPGGGYRDYRHSPSPSRRLRSPGRVFLCL